MVRSTAEKNRCKRERKKKEREARRKQEEEEKKRSEVAKKEEEEGKEEDDIEIEYVPEQVRVDGDAMESVLQRFQERASVVTEDEDEELVNEEEGQKKDGGDYDNDEYETDEDDEMVKNRLSKRKLREILRPSVAELKRRVSRPDLVEAHDVTAHDPDFLIQLKAIAGTVPVPRHWGRKRKYLQGKRGFEKPPFQLPDFIMKTGIAQVRDTLAETETSQSVKQKNRARVAPKMGAMDVDYGTLYEAFFKHQTKPDTLTKMGDLYYEGKELETRNKIQPGGPFSAALCEALGLTSGDVSQPPPWLINMQRYGPPPSYPNLKIPGLNAPLPSSECQFGYHEGGWGQPPVDNYGRPLYGGNPFDTPGDDQKEATPNETLVTSDGKTVAKAEWGGLPNAMDVGGGENDDEDEEEEEESSDEEMEESEEEEGEEKAPSGGVESVLPPPPKAAPTATDLRKQAGDETPLVATDNKPKQLYTILDQKPTSVSSSGQVFGSEVAYVMPPEGAESVLSKPVNPSSRKKQKRDDEDEEDLTKNFKF